MTFNPENKVRFEELAPSLQKLINSKANQTDTDTILKLVGGIRLTVSSTPPASPINNREIWINTTDNINLIMRYQNGWIDNNANIAKNIPTKDVGGNIWISDN